MVVLGRPSYGGPNPAWTTSRRQSGGVTRIRELEQAPISKALPLASPFILPPVRALDPLLLLLLLHHHHPAPVLLVAISDSEARVCATLLAAPRMLLSTMTHAHAD